MTGSETQKKRGAIVLGWWRHNIAARENAAARALSARLRRGGAAGALNERLVHDLARQLGFGPSNAEELVRLVTLLAEIREHDSAPLARRLGGKEPILSPSRFERLMRAEDEDLTALMRRAILMADLRCNVAQFAEDLLNWNSTTRNKWCFQYFGTDAPADTEDNAPQTTLEETSI